MVHSVATDRINEGGRLELNWCCSTTIRLPVHHSTHNTSLIKAQPDKHKKNECRGQTLLISSRGVCYTYISCRHQCVGQHGDVVVSVEPRHEQHAESHVHQERHQDVRFSADRQEDGREGDRTGGQLQHFQHWFISLRRLKQNNFNNVKLNTQRAAQTADQRHTHSEVTAHSQVSFSQY